MQISCVQQSWIITQKRPNNTKRKCAMICDILASMESLEAVMSGWQILLESHPWCHQNISPKLTLFQTFVEWDLAMVWWSVNCWVWGSWVSSAALSSNEFMKWQRTCLHTKGMTLTILLELLVQWASEWRKFDANIKFQEFLMMTSNLICIIHRRKRWAIKEQFFERVEWVKSRQKLQKIVFSFRINFSRIFQKLSYVLRVAFYLGNTKICVGEGCILWFRTQPSVLPPVASGTMQFRLSTQTSSYKNLLVLCKFCIVPSFEVESVGKGVFPKMDGTTRVALQWQCEQRC